MKATCNQTCQFYKRAMQLLPRPASMNAPMHACTWQFRLKMAGALPACNCGCHFRTQPRWRQGCPGLFLGSIGSGAVVWPWIVARPPPSTASAPQQSGLLNASGHVQTHGQVMAAIHFYCCQYVGAWRKETLHETARVLGICTWLICQLHAVVAKTACVGNNLGAQKLQRAPGMEVRNMRMLCRRLICARNGMLIL